MRVTKIVKEYITEEVKKRIPCEDLPEYAELNKRMQLAKETFIEVLDRSINDFIREINETYELPEGWQLKRVSRFNGTYGILQNYPDDEELYDLNRKHIEEMHKKREAAIKNILVTLELGGDKAELEKMLSEVGKDE